MNSIEEYKNKILVLCGKLESFRVLKEYEQVSKTANEGSKIVNDALDLVTQNPKLNYYSNDLTYMRNAFDKIIDGANKIQIMSTAYNC